MSKNQVLKANVKNVLSGDTFVLVPSAFKTATPPERMLTLAYVKAPGLQLNELHSFESKEYVSGLVLGKQVTFKVISKNSSNKEFGDVYANGNSLIQHLVSKGMVRVKENLSANSEEEDDFIGSLYETENKAKLDKVGLWSTQISKISLIDMNQDIIEKSKATPTTSIVDKVISGDRIIARIIVNKSTHIVSPVLLAGLKAPRTANTTESVSEPFAEESKYFVEKNILGKKVKLSVIGESQTGIPIAKIIYDNNINISQKILENGLAEIVDWQSSLLGSDIMSVLRNSEKLARVKGLGQWKSTAPVATPSHTGSLKLVPGKTVNAIITRIISSDTLNITLPNDEEYTVQLSSLKAPRQSDPATSPFISQAKEFARSTAIGKSVKVYVDAIRAENVEKHIDSRPLVTITLNNGKDLSEIIVGSGYANVIRHNKQTTNERSSNWDKLIELEIEAEKKKAGVNSTKIPGVERIVDASENLTRSKTFVNGFTKRGKITGIVEHIVSVNRYRIVLPRESTKLTIVLGGLENTKGLSDAGLKYINKKILQREVQFDVYGTDKTGAYIGNIYITGQLLPIQSNLLSQGFVKVHDVSVNSNSYGNEFIQSEKIAKDAKLGLWANYDETEKLTAKVSSIKLDEKKFYDVKVTDISNEGVISFQIIDKITPVFKNFKTSFETFNALPVVSSTPSSAELGTSPVTLTKHPKVGEYLSVKDSQENTYYRGRVVSHDKTTLKYTIRDIDYGFVDQVSLRDLRILPKRFSIQEMSAQAHTATLKAVKLPPSKPTDYLSEAIDHLDGLTYGKQLIAIAYTSSKDVEFEIILLEPSKATKTPLESINKDLVEQGWGIVDRSQSDIADLLDLESKAKSSRLGCWEFGDIDFEENDY